MTTDPPALRRKDWERPRFDRHQTRPEQAAEHLAAMAASAEPGDRLGTKEELRDACGVPGAGHRAFRTRRWIVRQPPIADGAPRQFDADR
jgi:hypothetical protein